MDLTKWLTIFPLAVIFVMSVYLLLFINVKKETKFIIAVKNVSLWLGSS